MWMQLAIILLVVCLGLAAVLRLGYTISTVHGESMFPTLIPGDRLLSFNLWPRFWLRKGQIVTGNKLPPSTELLAAVQSISDVDFTIVDKLASSGLALPDEFKNLDFKSETTFSKFIKRVIGLPGDTVCIPISTLHENLRPLISSRYSENGNLMWKIPENHCFLRGDGLCSIDSLLLGPIPLSAITGIAVLKLPRHSDVNSVQQLGGVRDVREA